MIETFPVRTVYGPLFHERTKDHLMVSFQKLSSINIKTNIYTVYKRYLGDPDGN